VSKPDRIRLTVVGGDIWMTVDGSRPIVGEVGHKFRSGSRMDWERDMFKDCLYVSDDGGTIEEFKGSDDEFFNIIVTE